MVSSSLLLRLLLSVNSGSCYFLWQNTLSSLAPLCEAVTIFEIKNNSDLLQWNGEKGMKAKTGQIWNHLITGASSSRSPTISESLSFVIAALSQRLAWQMTADVLDNCVCVCVWECVCERERACLIRHVNHQQAARFSGYKWNCLYESKSLGFLFYYLNRQWATELPDTVVCVCVWVCVEWEHVCYTFTHVCADTCFGAETQKTVLWSWR